MNLWILSLLVFGCVILHCDGLPRKDNSEIQAKVASLLRLLTKRNNGERRLNNDDIGTEKQKPIPTDKRPAVVKSDFRTTPCGSVPVELTAPSGTIRSPGYAEDRYPNDATCKWRITAPAGQMISVTFQKLSLEGHPSGNCGYDSLSLYDGSSAASPRLAKVCTAAPPTITSSGSSLFVVFKSDFSVNSGRFSLSWTFVGQGGQGGDCNPTPDGHQYRGNTSVTESGKQCQAWASQSPHQHSFNQDGMFPDVSVNNASNYCRNPDNNWNEGLWCYTTDPGTRWERCDVPACGTSGGPDACSGSAPVELTANSGTIQSPGYATNTYPNNAHCRWRITAPSGKVISVTFQSLSLEEHPSGNCGYDNVSLYDGSSAASSQLANVCTAAPPTITSSSSSLFVVFKSDSSVNSGRFSLSWTFVSQGGRAICGKPAIEPSVTSMRIVGGVEARKNSWPWQCRVLKKKNGVWYGCGGSVISNRHILTAAHCVPSTTSQKRRTATYTRVQAGSLVVKCGLHNRRDSSDPAVQTFSDVTAVVHENYNKATIDSDVAIIQLSTALTFNNYVQPVCLPSSRVPAGTNCVVTGWGQTNNTGDNDVLRQVGIPIASSQHCSSEYGRYFTENMLCAGPLAGGKGMCFGDSGGPLVCKRGDKWLQYGVVSWTWGGCAKPNHPGVYVDVVKFLPWIQQKSGVRPSARMKSNDNLKPQDDLYETEKQLLDLLQRKIADE